MKADFDALRDASARRDALLNSGLGPLVEVSLNLAQGSIGLDVAKEQAAQFGARGQASSDQIITLAETARQAAYEGAWRDARGLAELCHEAASAAQANHPADVGYAEARAVAAADLTEVLHGGLFEAGDVRLYRRAREVTEAAIEASRGIGLTTLVGLLSLRFGTLLVDAYTANRTPENYDLQFGEWVARALNAGDPELISLVSRPVGTPADDDATRGGWPVAIEALREAEGRLRAASEIVIPEHRGPALKALSQALEWQELLGAAIDRAEMLAVSERALAEFDPSDLNGRLALLATIERFGVDVSGDSAIAQLEEALTDYVARTDERTAWSAIAQAVALLSSTDPERALKLLDHHRELENAWADEGLRQRHFDVELTLFVEAFRPDTALITDAAGFDRALAAVPALAAGANSAETARAAAAGLLAVMRVSSAFDREEAALGLRDTLAGLDATLWAEHEQAVAYLLATLMRGEGVNRWRAGAVDGAGKYYMQAADAYQNVGINVQMVQCIKDLCDVAASASTPELNELTAWLAARSPALEQAAPSDAPAAVRDLASRVLAAQAVTGTSTEVVQLLLQVAKGRRFATLLANGTRQFQPGPSAAYLLRLAAEAEGQLPEDSDLLRPTPFDDALGDDELVTAWVDEYETGPSETPGDRLGNLQRAAERQLMAALTPTAWAPPALIAQIKSHLDPRTALVQLFEGPISDGRLGSWQLLLTRDLEHLAVGAGQLPSGHARASWRGRSVTMPFAGMWVGQIRRSIQSDPGPLDVAPEARNMLGSAYDRYFRVLDQCREPLAAAGIDRVIVVPHAASRFLPLHLTGPGEETLADKWTVTYLANLAQLTVDHRAARRREDVGVFALSYADQPRLPYLEDSAAEAQAIAAECGVEPALDEAATEGAFRESLESCRYVHLRAHGRLYVDAPMFHTVFLHPSDPDDGRLRAYEVLPLDLSGLELVTLGACETALGRVDAADNPRGLPAALLLAGAQAVIGTLWPVLAPASTCFFTELYRRLMAGDEDLRGAFANAQRVTRQSFPQYRDWGAFYLIGGVAAAERR